jgi:hypothetical protein
MGSIDRRITVQGWPWAKARTYLNNKSEKRLGL